MINFSNEDIKTRAPEWSLNDDVKLLNKLKNLDELLSNKTKQILDNVNEADNKIVAETILVKNLINDFHLIGHKQFIENRVEEEENENKLFNKSNESDQSFKDTTTDPDSLIHEQMKIALNNSLQFIRAKKNDFNNRSNDQVTDQQQQQQQQTPSIDQLSYDKYVERLIQNSKYYQNKLPPIVNSDEFMSEIYSLVKQSSITVKARMKVNSSLTESRASSIISDVENISINEKVLEINENNFIGHLSNSARSSASYDEITRKDIQSFSPSNVESKSSLNQTSSHKTAAFKQQEQQQDKITKSPISNENVNQNVSSNIVNENVKLRNELDAIFGNVNTATSSVASSSAKNRLFDYDDSDDELFKPSQTEKRLSKDLFKSDSSIDSIQPTTSSTSKIATHKTTANLFESNIKSTAQSTLQPTTATTTNTIQSNQPSTSQSSTTSLVKETAGTIQKSSDQLMSKKKNIFDKLFESDDSDDELFSSSTKNKSKVLIEKQQEPNKKPFNNTADEKINQSIVEQEIESVAKNTVKVNQQQNLSNIEPILIKEKPDKVTISRQEVEEVEKEKSNEKLVDNSEKMSTKKELFKNQLEDLFSKKRNPNLGLVKVNKEAVISSSATDDSDDNEKNKENLTIDNTSTISNAKKSQSETVSNSSITNKTSNSTNVSKNDQTPQNIQSSSQFDLFSDDLSPANTLTLDNNLVKSRVRPNQARRKRPMKAKTTTNQLNHDAQSIDKSTVESTVQVHLEQKEEKLKEIENAQKSIDKNKTTTTNVTNDATKLDAKIITKTNKTNAKDALEKTTKSSIIDEDSSADEDKDDYFKEINKKSQAKKNEELDKKFKTLFDSDDDDDLLFSPSNKKSSSNKETSPATTTPLKSKSESNQSSNTSTSPNKKLLLKSTETHSSANVKRSLKSTIFDDSDSDDDELFKK